MQDQIQNENQWMWSARTMPENSNKQFSGNQEVSSANELNTLNTLLGAMWGLNDTISFSAIVPFQNKELSTTLGGTSSKITNNGLDDLKLNALALLQQTE